MGKIKQLSQEVIAQIAAGEVIERPAYVVKELIENALDAGANEIEINIENAGLDKIEVIDNGVGMSEVDLLECFKPHTTSKIENIEDLNLIKTLGFRGEALASIAGVSTLAIESRTKNSDTGFRVLLNKLQVRDSGSVGRQKGTKVTVSNLFEEIPARKKFLKHPLTEMRLITEIVSHFALVHPEVCFKLTHNGRVLFDQLQSDFNDRLTQIWGEDFVLHTLPVNYKSSFVSISGVIGKPQLGAATSNKLWIFVNGRKVSDPLVHGAVKEGFGTLLMARTHPTGVLFLEVPPEIVDVNVHPTKSEVRFARAEEIFQEVKVATLETLSNNNLIYTKGSLDEASELKQELKSVVSAAEILQLGTLSNRPILQIHNSFLVLETDSGFQILDQHAAHESLLYFEFLDAWESKKAKKESYQLQNPIIMDLTTTQALLLEEHLDKLASLGFDLELFGDKTYKVTSVPALYKDQDIKEVILEVLETLSGPTTALTEKQHHFLATLACKSAIKAGQTLTEEQTEKLVLALDAKHLAYTCPHGRPVRIEITLGELARMFKRK